MKLEIPFNKDIYIKQINLNFDLTWKPILKKHNRNLYISIFFFLLGILIIYGKNNLGFYFAAIGIYGGFEYYKIKVAQKESKNKYNNFVEKEIHEQTESNENSIWEFNEEYFRYKSYKYDTKIKWVAFSSYRIIEENIFLDLNIGNQLSYILAKEEIGENAYQNIITFLKEKLDKTSH